MKRGKACLDQGAAAFLAKPIRAETLREVVGRVLEDAARQAREGSLAVLAMEVGGLLFAVPLDSVVRVAFSEPVAQMGCVYSRLCENPALGHTGQKLDIASISGNKITETYLNWPSRILDIKGTWNAYADIEKFLFYFLGTWSYMMVDFKH